MPIQASNLRGYLCRGLAGALAAMWVLLGATQSFGALPTPTDESFSARAWQAEDGLPENRVVGVVQAPDGFLWLATQGQVVRFDGVRFQRVDLAETPGVIAGTMRGLLLDRAGRVWLAKEEGGALFCFKDAQVRVLSPELGLPKNEAQSSMADDGAGGLWIAYSSGKLVRCHHDGKVDTFTGQDGLPGGGGSCWLASTGDGTLWFAKGRQVGVFRNGQFQVLLSCESAAVRIASARSGGIWICDGNQILKFVEGKVPVAWGRIVPADARERSSAEPSVLLEDRVGAVWVGTVASGLFRCTSNSVVRVEVSNPAILSLAEDREGNLWVGTRGGGLSRVHRRVTSLINTADGLPFEGVQSVCQDAAGALWVVGDNGVLARGRGTNWVVQSPLSSSAPVFVTCAAAAANGSVWVGTRGGSLYRWDAGQFTGLGLRGSLHEKSVRSLLVARNTDLWIATDASDSLYRLHKDQLQTFSLPPGRRFIRAMAEDGEGDFWAGASDGMLVRVAGDVLKVETAISASLSIRCLHAAKDGDLWIGYAGAGVGRFREGRITRFNTDQGLPNEYVSQILEDGRSGLWFAGNRGIFQVRERDFDSVTARAATRVWAVLYGRSEGVPGLQASFDYWPTAVRTPDDRLFFSMLSGLAEVRLDDAPPSNCPPPVCIERVTADDQTLAVYDNFNAAEITNATGPIELSGRSPRDELRIPPGRQQVQFEFTALSFTAPENVQFRYQLEGLDENWVDAGTRRVASYTHPPPGRFRFKVIACNNEGVWNSTGDTLAVAFAPYLWETIWFKLAITAISFIVLCGIVVLVLRRRHRLELERLEHQRALELERTRIARDLHDDLGVGLTEIGLLGDLAGASPLVPEPSREKLQEITGRARTLAASLDEIVWAINPVNDTSQSLMDYFFEYAQRLLGRAGIRCRLKAIEPMSAGSLNAEDRHEVFHAFKEALNNVIRHSGASEVQISVAAAQGQLVVCVTDNGCGFVTPGGEGSRDGLVGMRARLQRLGGRCEINGTSGGGTTVTFSIPMQPNTQP